LRSCKDFCPSLGFVLGRREACFELLGFDFILDEEQRLEDSQDIDLASFGMATELANGFGLILEGVSGEVSPVHCVWVWVKWAGSSS
jgi:hypothetical protein